MDNDIDIYNNAHYELVTEIDNMGSRLSMVQNEYELLS